MTVMHLTFDTFNTDTKIHWALTMCTVLRILEILSTLKFTSP